MSNHCLGRLETALNHYEVAKRTLGDDAAGRGIYSLIGVALIQLGKPDLGRERLLAAVDETRTLFEAHPDNPRIGNELAYLYAALGERESFLDTARRIREATPETGAQLSDLALGAALLGDRERVVTMLRDALDSGYVCSYWPEYMDFTRISLEGVAGYDEFVEEFEARVEQLRRRYPPPDLD
jgi:tetratricopeptide (TPR) repeat protein